jgi:hypothetical protein
MMDKQQAKQYRDSLIEEHIGIEKEADIYDITIQEAILIGQIKCLTHLIGDGYYDPIIRNMTEITSFEE